MKTIPMSDPSILRKHHQCVCLHVCGLVFKIGVSEMELKNEVLGWVFSLGALLATLTID